MEPYTFTFKMKSLSEIEEFLKSIGINPLFKI
jgi:hypothetical protein